MRQLPAPGAVHPNPGLPYQGTQRRAFLPASPRGRAILLRLMRAWDARILFSVGTSLTTGRPNSVVWGIIHHKTQIYNGPTQFGYPDPEYLSRVEGELTDAGIE